MRDLDSLDLQIVLPGSNNARSKDLSTAEIVLEFSIQKRMLSC